MFNSEQKSTRTSSLLVFVLIFTGTVQALETVPYAYGQKNYGSDLEDTDPEMMFAILASLGQTIVREDDMENTKRGLDLGLNRGYSGSQQAKHMMGIAAAGLSGGPGRRRRSQNTYRYGLPN